MHAFRISVAPGALQIGIAPFLGDGTPIMSNYVPVLDGPSFLWGLAVFGAGVLLLTLRSLAAVPRVGVRLDGADVQHEAVRQALPVVGPKAWLTGFEPAYQRYVLKFWVEEFCQHDDLESDVLKRLWHRFSTEGVPLRSPYPVRLESPN